MLNDIFEKLNVHSDSDKALIEYVWLRYSTKFKHFSEDEFVIDWTKFQSIPTFKALDNVYDVMGENFDLSKTTHFVMRTVAQFHIEKALVALKFDVDTDDNLKEEIGSGNIGTAGRIAKIWGGNGLDAENLREYGEGRFTKEPRLATFPATEKDSRKPVTVTIKNNGIGSVCSHHFLPFSIESGDSSQIVISYIPNKKLLGLSKIGRFVEWCLNRPSLQEEVTELIHKKIKEIAETEDVYVGLFNLVHTCEVTRGAKQYSTTTTEEYSGAFNSTDLRTQILL